MLDAKVLFEMFEDMNFMEIYKYLEDMPVDEYLEMMNNMTTEERDKLWKMQEEKFDEYVEMQDEYVEMQDEYVEMQDEYFYMQDEDLVYA